MKHDALHKRRGAAAAKQPVPEPLEAQDLQRATEAAEAFFALWQDALRDAAKLQDIMPRGQQGRSKDGV